MLKVISFKICPFVQRVTALLELRGLDYQVEYISLKDKPEWFLEISPNGQVPVLVTESGAALFESEAIVEYIETVYPGPKPIPSPEKRAEERAWGYLAAKNYLVQCGAMRSPTADVLAERGGKLDAAFAKIDRHLPTTRFFGGDTPGWVDIAWLPLLHRAAIVENNSGYDLLGDRPRLRAWQRALLETGIADRSVSDDFDEAFSRFYLSDETYLGRRCCEASGADTTANKRVSSCACC